MSESNGIEMVPPGVKLEKAPTGIRGFDEITGGGLPRGRPTLVCGGPGCGKTMFGMEFLIRGATELDEPGVLVSFEESAVDLAKNVASLGFDLGALVEQGKIAVDHVRVERSEIEETGEFDLDGLFVRLGFAIDRLKARRVMLDTIEALFSALPNEGILRAELRRLFAWLRERDVTAVITAERGEGALTRRGLEEYVSDCVILLDQRVHDQIATRRLRVVKYRGSPHGTNEYPFLIHERGLSVLPATSLGTSHRASLERLSLGLPRLDAMLGGKGIYRGSTVLLSGTAGSGKSSLAATATAAACARGERCLYFAFEESESQILRNMRSIGIDLKPWVESGLLRFHVVRPNTFGLEMHLALMHQQIEAFEPHVVLMDPITNLITVGTRIDVRSMLVRFIDFLKVQQITVLFTSLTSGDAALEHTDVGISSLMDTWLLVRFIEANGERNRALYVLKSRGMAHSNQVREYVMSERGIELLDVSSGPSGVLTGTARRAEERREQATRIAREQEVELRQRALDRKRDLVAGKIAAMQAELAGDEEELQRMLGVEQRREIEASRARAEMVRLRQGDQARIQIDGSQPEEGAQ